MVQDLDFFFFCFGAISQGLGKYEYQFYICSDFYFLPKSTVDALLTKLVHRPEIIQVIAGPRYKVIQSNASCDYQII